jgi:TolA-binding protein
MSNDRNMTEKVLDWFEANSAARTRCGPLAKALKANPAHLATTLNNLATRGDLARVKVTVPKDIGGGEQWEYWLPIGGKVIAPPAPYVPAKAFRRDTAAQSATKAEEPHLSTAQLEAKIEELQQEIRERKQGHALATETLSNQAKKIEQLELTLSERNGRITELERVEILNKGLIDLTERGLDKATAMIDEVKVDMGAKLSEAHARIADLEAALAEANTRTTATVEHREPAGYVVVTPRKPLRRTKLGKNAQALAMSAARANGFAEVYAIYPAGKAVRGAEWRPTSWPC